MEKMSFKNWMIIQEGQTSGKTGLYPLGYGGIGLYPIQSYIPRSADAFLYISLDDRLYDNGDGPPFDIRHIPGHKQYKNPNSGTKEPFNIRHIKGPEPETEKHNNSKEKSPFSIVHIKK